MTNEFLTSLEDPLDKFLLSKIVGIQKMVWFRLQKKDPFTLLFKTSFNEHVAFEKRSLRPPQKKGRPPVNHGESLPDLKREAKINAIKPPKYKDLQKLLDFIPPIYHSFYKDIKIADPISKKPKNDKKKSASDEKENGEVKVEECDNVLFTDDES